MQSEQRNFILAIVLSGLILFGWSTLASRWFPPANPPVTKVQGGKTTPLPAPGAPPPVTAQAAKQSREAVLAASPRLPIRNAKVSGSLNLKGARIDDLMLTSYRETVAKNSPNVRLLSPQGAPQAYFASFDWMGAGVAVPNADTVWTADKTELTPTSPVTLRWDNGQGQVFVLKIAVDDQYMFTIDQRVANVSGAPIVARPYAVVNRAEKPADPDNWIAHVGPIGALNNAVDYDVTYENLEGKEPSFFGKMFGTKAVAGVNAATSTGGWLGFGDKYWLTALAPQGAAKIDAGFRSGEGSFQADFVRNPVTVQPGRAAGVVTHFFAGAKQINVLDGYEADLKIPLFGKAIDWGWFEIFEKPLFHYLHWLFGIIGNFGLAIMALTLTVRGLMFPIAQKQFQSMAAMRIVQPKMKAIQDRHKDDKARQQQEIMQLYKTEKINPLAGCLPVFIQMPIFFALYKVLMLTIEMRHQPFVGWIQDLSVPDPLTPVNLFGLLPFTPPHIIAIGVLPIILGVTMYIQFKLNPPPPDPVQAQMFSIMPWVLMFVMAPFAAGLQLYWATSNILTIAQQKWLYSKYPELKNSPPRRPWHDDCGKRCAPAKAGALASERGACFHGSCFRRSTNVTDETDLLETARKIFAGPIAFLKSAPSLIHLPDPDVPEVAFAGRSNVGKSSLLNALTNRNGLARTSNTPGRTQELNFFDIGEPLRFRLVDMPGYGFAEAPKDVVKKWRFLINDYLRGRQVLGRAFVLVDARHGVKPVDDEIMDMLDAAAVSYRIVITKADKVKATDLADVAARTAETVRKRAAAHPEIIVTSSEKGMGIPELRAAVFQSTLR